MALLSRKKTSPKGAGYTITETRTSGKAAKTRTMTSTSGGVKTSRNMSTGKVTKRKIK